MMVQIIVAFKVYLNEAQVLHHVLWDITKQIVLQLVNIPGRPSLDCLVEELDSFNADLSAHLDRIRSGSRHYGGNSQQDQQDRQRIREYVCAVNAYEHMGAKFSDAFRSLSEGL